MPILISQPTYSTLVYTKDEVDAVLDTKADKIPGDVEGNIVLLDGPTGNTLDSGLTIDDLLLGSPINGGEF